MRTGLRGHRLAAALAVRVRLLILLHILLLVPSVHGQAPRVPFSGIYGGTAGAGAITGWDRSGGGDNPATLGAPGWTAGVAAYAPFGIEGLRVAEASVAWDRARWGLSGSYTGMFAQGSEGSGGGDGVGGVQATGVGLQSAMRLGRGLTLGVAGDYHTEPGVGGAGGAVGLLWRPQSWGSLGAFWNRETSTWGDAMRAGAGAEGGFDFFGVAWRLCAEAIYASEQSGGEWAFRFATGLRLHPLLSIYAGLDPARETAALGVRFGIGDWEGFSAMRRHRSLGGTTVQGIRWYHVDKKMIKPKTNFE